MAEIVSSETNTAASSAQAQTTATPALPRLAYSLQETAELLGVSYISVWRLVARGELRCSKAIRHHIVAKQEIERFLCETAE
jgi:hypothetical protein